MEYKGFTGPRKFEVPELRNKKTNELVRKAKTYFQYECDKCGSSIYDEGNALEEHIKECHDSISNLCKQKESKIEELCNQLTYRTGLEKKV